MHNKDVRAKTDIFSQIIDDKEYLVLITSWIAVHLDEILKGISVSDTYEEGSIVLFLLKIHNYFVEVANFDGNIT